MDGIHDLGGMDGFGPVPVDETESGHEGWEARLQAVALLGGFRRSAIEALAPTTYLSSSYAERWLLACERVNLARGTITSDDLERWREHLAADAGVVPPRRDDPELTARVERHLARAPEVPPASDPSFAVGERVRVRRSRPAVHHRCPRYVRGVIGTVESVVGDHPLLEAGRDEPLEAVYTISFRSEDLWGPPADGVGHDLRIDLWQSQLEAAPRDPLAPAVSSS